MNSSTRRICEIILLPVSQLLNLVIGAFLPPFIIKYIGKDGYGFVAMIASLGASTMLFQLGVPVSCTRYLSIVNSRNGRGASAVLSNSLLLAMVSAVAAAGLFVWAFWNMCSGRDVQQMGDIHQCKYAIAAIGASYIVFILLSPYQSVMQAQEKFITISIVQASNSVVRVSLTLILLPVIAAGLAAYSTIYAVIIVLPVTTYLVLNAMSSNCIEAQASNLSWGEALVLLKHGGIISVNVLLWHMMTTFNVLVIGWIMGPAQVAYLVLALVWSNLVQAITTAVNQILLPAAARHELHERTEELQSIARISSKLLFMVLMPVFVFLIVFGRSVVAVWLGPGYSLTAQLLPLVLLGDVFTTINSPVGSMISAMNLSKVVVARNLKITPVLFVLQVAGVGLFGFGPIWVVAISLVNSVVRAIYCYGEPFSKFVGEQFLLHLRETYGKPLVAFALACFALGVIAGLTGPLTMMGLAIFVPIAMTISWSLFFCIAFSRQERDQALSVGARAFEKTCLWLQAR